jgi:hypothetical protein
MEQGRGHRRGRPETEIDQLIQPESLTGRRAKGMLRHGACYIGGLPLFHMWIDDELH